MQPRIRALRPDVVVYDSGDTHWRGGVVTAVGATVTIRYLGEASLVKTANVSLAVAGTRTVGAPVVVRVTGSSPNWTIAEVRDGWWGGAGPGTDEAGAIARGEYHYSVVPRAITNEPEEYPWTAA
jgi:hypothetical protein